MSTSMAKSIGDTTPPAQAFSYAQAAKGRSPSASATLQPRKSSLDISSSSSSTSLRQSAEARGMPSEMKVRRASEGQISVENLIEAVVKSEADLTAERSTKLNTTQQILQQAPGAAVSGSLVKPAHSSPSSPSFGTTSISTLPKEEDVFATPNGSSESTWDKISQSSQNGEKFSSKPDADEVESKVASWEHVPAVAQLKEAPAPTFNVWQKRAMDAQVRASKDAKSLHTMTVTNHNKEVSHVQPGRRVQEITPDVSKMEMRKKTRPSTSMTEERASFSASRDSSKTAEGKYRSGEEERKFSSGKRPIDTTKPVVGNAAPPPPPGDAISWPTPDSAQEEEKKKLQDRSEKGDKDRPSTTKAHGREKWVPVPYVPSAVFNTPLPPSRRGGRAARGARDVGGRGGHTIHNNCGGDRSPTAGPNSSGDVPAPNTERNRGDMGPPRGGTFSSRPKRAVSAGPPTVREQRRTTEPSLQDKREEPLPAGQKSLQNTRSTTIGSRRASTATQTENSQVNGQVSPLRSRSDAQSGKRVFSNSTEYEQGQQSNHPDHTSARSVSDRRNEGSTRQLDSFRDNNNFVHSRDRGEGRGERGRGGFRGRGGHNGFSNSHSINNPSMSSSQPNNQPPQGYVQSKSQSYSERQAAQMQGAPFASTPRDSRHYRTSSRSHSIPNPNSFSRFPGPPGANPHLPALQTDLANMYGYQPGQQAVMSAMSYHPYMEQIQLLGMVQMQMEYYFSLDNLVKDLFLRSHMDSQGFAFLSVLVKFNRIRQLTSDIDLIRYVCQNSPVIDLQTGTDGIDRIRKAEGWQQWVLTKDKRDIAAQNEAPVQMQQGHPPQVPWELYRAHSGGSNLSPRSSFTSARPRVIDASLGPAVNGAIVSSSQPLSQGTSNGLLTDGLITQTPLSAAVPDFTPGLQQVQGDHAPVPETEAHPENTFSDEQVENLMIVIRKPSTTLTPPISTLPSTFSRTFSNGSIDARSISDEIAGVGDPRSVPGTNGDFLSDSRDPDSLQHSLSPFTFGSAPRQPSSMQLPVFWVKDKETPIDDLPNDLTHESYTVFHRNALQQRKLSPRGECHRDMDILFQFWSHFLIRNFNTRMYEEFRQLAFEDATQRESSVGLRNLIQYYDESVLGQKVIADDIARDYVDLVKVESLRDNIALQKLRAAWRNGAMNLKNRVKIDKIIDTDLKAELER